MGQQVNVYKELKFFPGATISGMPGTGEGRTYYVNNITGNASADGLSWNSAVKQVSDAITLSEAYRELGGRKSSVTTNDYIRNTILVQGTGDYLGTEGGYDSLTDLGEHYNLIGLGTPGGRGYGVGLVRIGKDTGETVGGVEATSSGFRGVYISNIQFQSGDTSSCFAVQNLYTSMLEDCGFQVAPAITGTPNAYFAISGGCTGLTLRRCNSGGQSSMTDRPVYGIDLTGATFFAASLIEQCSIGGTTAGFYNPSTQIYGRGTVVRDNVIGDLGMGVMILGIRDACERSLAAGGLITYVNNYIQATTPIDISPIQAWERCIMNYADNAVITSYG